MEGKITRRDFLKWSAITVAGSSAFAHGSDAVSEPSSYTHGRNDVMLMGGSISLSNPLVSESQLGFRIGLARTRTSSYPLDSMDFIMMDLERPDNCSRHAHWCTGDLTGRLLEFLSCSDGVDGKSDPRLSQLFERILKQRRPSGLFGKYAGQPKNVVPEDDINSGADRLFCGLIRYYDLTGNEQALESAEGVANWLISRTDVWRTQLKNTGGRIIYAWVTEPFARLYGITRDQRYLDFCGMINENLETCEKGVHAHGYMSTLRGLQVATLITGDKAWNDKPEQNRRIIIDKHYEMPDGCTPEGFPSSPANEGCSIADWLMLNLNAGLISGDDSAYEKAERIFWNALAFNQWITGGFGHRALTPIGYGMSRFEEAWWCCVHDAGIAMSEYARHAVTFRDNAVHINLLVPGKYELPLPDGQNAEVRIDTRYPASGEAIIEAKNIPADISVKVRVPGCIRKPDLSETRSADKVRVALKGRLGHRIEECQSGVMLTYGPLVLAPLFALSASSLDTPLLKVGEKADSDGFLQLSNTPLPEWSYFDEGPGARCWVEGSAVNVPVRFPNGDVRELHFCPLCYNTSNLTLYETPIVFQGVAE